MPTGGVVLDAFKNLMRHGNKASHAQEAQDAARQHRDKSPISTQPRNTNANQPAAAPSSAQEKPAKGDSKMKSQAFQKEAEEMVQHEKAAKAKMPSYKGLERFQLLDKMGDGAFSNVYKALDLTTGQKVAVKVVRKYELNSTMRANILKEVQIMRGTSHPSVVKLISFSESDEFYFLVLELMEGGELFHQIVKLTYFSENLCRHVILQVAHGIRYLHEERGVVHRDIKPENLLFDRIPIIPSKNPVQRPYDEEKEDEGEFIPGVGGGGIGRVKIADFGLSKVVWNEETMTPCGTVGYTAPEIVRDERYSKSVDMWALGCVLYTLLCGFPPFYDESINVLTEKVARGYYTFLSPWWDDISASAKDLITHLLCVDPTQRYTIDEFLAHPWCNEAPAPPPPPTPLVHNRPLDSPLLMMAVRGGREGRSPGLATLKEAFDITYAVHRMEEEGARRRAFNGGGTGMRGILQGLNEEDNEGAEDQRMIEAVRQQRHEEPRRIVVTTGARSNHAHGRTAKPAHDIRLNEGRAGPRDRSHGKAFNLDMQGATLLGRRQRQVGDPSPLSRQLQGGLLDVPGSPMQIG